MRGKSFRAVWLAGISVSCLIASPAGAHSADEEVAAADSAQDASDEQASAVADRSSVEDNHLGDIVVTAERRETSLQRSPTSVAALTSEALAARGIVSAADLQGLVAGLEMQPFGNLLATIRGVGTFSIQPGVDSSVAYMVDGVSLPHPSAIPPLFFDLERVEVLRGPQGTLYGRNSNAGAVNQITAKPQNHFAARASVTIGNYDLITTEAMLNVPLAEGVAIRGAFASSNHGPYLDNGFNDDDTIAARVHLGAEISQNVHLIVTADYAKSDRMTGSQSPCPPNTDLTLSPGCVGVEWKPFLGLPGQPDDDFEWTRSKGIYAELDVDLGWGTLTYIPSYREVDFDQKLTNLGAFAPTTSREYHTQELRLSSPSGSPITWVGGLFYSDENLSDHSELHNTAPDAPFRVTNVFDTPNYTAKSIAAFGQVTIPLTDTFRITGGLRYTEEDKDSSGTVGTYCLNGTGQPNNPDCPATFPDAPALLSADTEASLELNKLTWKVGAELDVGPSSLVYVQASTGFKSGGLNRVPLDSGFPATYGPEYITAYQAGSKNRFLNNRLQVNAEVFYYDYSGFQSLGLRSAPPGIQVFLTLDAQKSTFYGGELEMTFLASPKDRFDLAVSVLHAKHDRFVIPLIGRDFSGYDVRNAPPFSATLSYQRTVDFSDGSYLTGMISSSFVAGHYVEISNHPGSFQSDYMMSDANLRYQFPNEKLALTAWIRNIENKGVMHTAAAQVVPQSFGFTNPPRTFGLTISANID